MLIPSIDLMGGKIVQLAHGESKSLEFADFEPWIKKFERYPLVHVVDLDAARREGSNRALVEKLSKRLHCQVGGGVATAEIAKQFLEAGAKRVVIGSGVIKDEKIDHEFASGMAAKVGADKVVYAVDTRHGLITVSGWRKTVQITLEEAIQQLEPYCTAFMHTHVDTDAGMSGLPINVARDLVKLTKKHLIVGGGIRTVDEVAELDALGVDAVVGMAIYSGEMAV